MIISERPLFGPCVELECEGVRAVVAPHLGMALVEFSVESVNILDMSRQEVFLQYRKGLGPLIFPHFNQSQIFPKVDLAQFSHVVHLLNIGVRDPFQHGVGRYSAWHFEMVPNGVAGKIDGNDSLNGISLCELNGFNFSAQVTYSLDKAGLSIRFDVSGEEPVEAGIHFYYDLVNPSTATVSLPVEEVSAPLTLPLSQSYDRVFHPRKDMGKNQTYLLMTDRYELQTTVLVEGSPEETFDSVTIFSPANARFVCVEPLSSSFKGVNIKRHFHGAILLTPRVRKR